MTKIPVVIGKNRLRGNAVGAMVDDDYGENNLDRLRQLLREEATREGVTVTPEWMSNSVSHLLKRFEVADAEWRDQKNGAIGAAYEATFPSGRVLMMASRQVLAHL